MGIKAGLPWNYDIDHGVVFSQRILWILLFFRICKRFIGQWYGSARENINMKISSLGIILTFVTLDDKFATPAWR